MLLNQQRRGMSTGLASPQSSGGAWLTCAAVAKVQLWLTCAAVAEVPVLLVRALVHLQMPF